MPARRISRIALAACGCIGAVILIGGSTRAAEEAASNPGPAFRQYCFQCHGKTSPMGGVSLELLTAESSVGDSFQKWQRVAAALEQKRMPPKGMPQPSDAERSQAVSWIRSELGAYARKHDGEPGRVTVRRLTSG